MPDWHQSIGSFSVKELIGRIIHRISYLFFLSLVIVQIKSKLKKRVATDRWWCHHVNNRPKYFPEKNCCRTERLNSFCFQSAINFIHSFSARTLHRPGTQKIELNLNFKWQVICFQCYQVYEANNARDALAKATYRRLYTADYLISSSIESIRAFRSSHPAVTSATLTLPVLTLSVFAQTWFKLSLATFGWDTHPAMFWSVTPITWPIPLHSINWLATASEGGQSCLLF